MDVEEMLRRELREVAAGVRVPEMPAPPDDRPGRHRYRLPLLVAAAVAVIVGGAGALVATNGPGTHPRPAHPAPTHPQPTHPQPTPQDHRTPEPISKAAPKVPYIVDGRLHVDGSRVPGAWATVEYGDRAWLAMRRDGTWWWGYSTQPKSISALADVPPVISPNGKYVGDVVIRNGKAFVDGFDTRPAGEGLGGVPVELGVPGSGDPVRVRAVTDDAEVIVQGRGTSLLWLPFAAGGGRTVDLSSTAPGQMVLAGTAAGLVVTDGEDGAPYLAKISDTGRLTRIGTLPSPDVVVSPDGGRLAWPGADTGGDVVSVPSLDVQSVDGGERSSWTAPDGWQFSVRSWAWEDGTHLLARVVGENGERMARCQVGQTRCVLIAAG